jgi:hypothetical protein
MTESPTNGPLWPRICISTIVKMIKQTRALDAGLLRVVALVALIAVFGFYSITLATTLALHS